MNEPEVEYLAFAVHLAQNHRFTSLGYIISTFPTKSPANLSDFTLYFDLKFSSHRPRKHPSHPRDRKHHKNALQTSRPAPSHRRMQTLRLRRRSPLGSPKVTSFCSHHPFPPIKQLTFHLRYWHQAYSLFQYYDDDIRLTDDAWFGSWVQVPHARFLFWS